MVPPRAAQNRGVSHFHSYIAEAENFTNAAAGYTTVRCVYGGVGADISCVHLEGVDCKIQFVLD